MLVFIDESGDAGFKLAKGSSPIFAVAMAIFHTREAASSAGSVIRNVRDRTGVKPEFKFSKLNDANRDAFFEAVRCCEFRVRAIVVEKEKIYSPHLRAEKEDFYRFFVKTMMRFDNGVLNNASVVIDGSGDRAFRNGLKTYLRKGTASGAVANVRFKDSKSDPLVQLSDMCVGAIARSFRPERSDKDRWRNMLKPRIDNIWEFK